MRRTISVMAIILSVMLAVQPAIASEKKQQSDRGMKVPEYVVNISKENTYPNPTQDLPHLQPSPLARKLLDSVHVKIENPTLIKMLNETSVNPSKASIGFRAKIFLGEWPLSYESEETNVNWEFRKVNVNKVDNRGGTTMQKIFYEQDKDQRVSGDLTAKVNNSDEVKKMMMMAAAEKTGLPLAFQTVIGKGTKKDQVYNVPPKKFAYLNAFVPAVNEKGKVTYGEVYLVLTGSRMEIEVKNITHQGIGAWIPIQDHIALKYVAGNPAY
ncbi:MAG TPA: YfkD family protein [Bacillales bacterium]|nr:YfkD family protein [Bacillales bacterium]